MGHSEANGRKFINRLWELLDDYQREVEDSLLSQSSKTDYIMFAEQFVRWVDGDFIPGGQLENRETNSTGS